ncbi:MAG: GNAT family N-acetyltransferase [Acidobacteriota bacterium]|nr:GNAT family N-acetyltransferase [Acidobacteriota bacterium]
MLRLEVISDFTRLLSLRDDWRELWESSPSPTPFNSPDWLITWWEHFGSGELRVFLVKDDEPRIVGIIPSFLHNWNRQRQLTLLGSGISDYLDPIILPEHRGEVIRCLTDYLERDGEWERVDWQDLSCDMSLAGLSSDEKLAAHAQPDLACSEIITNRSFSEYWDERPAGLRRNVRRYRNKAEQIGKLEFHITRSYNEKCLQTLFALHGERWRERGEPGMITINKSEPFLRAVAQVFAPRQMLTFFTLTFEGELAAVILGFPCRNMIYAYLSAFDPSYAEFGFGRILLFEALRHAWEQKFQSWNFLRGDEAYKQEWGARVIPKVRLVVTRQPIAP